MSRLIAMSAADVRAVEKAIEIVREDRDEDGFLRSGLELRDLLVRLEEIVARFYVAAETTEGTP